MSVFTFSSDMLSVLTTELANLNANIDTPGAGATAYEDILADISQTEIVDYGKSPTEQQA